MARRLHPANWVDEALSRYVFDIETDNLLDKLTKVHSLVLKDIDTGEVISCFAGNPATHGYDPIETGLALLADAALIVGHNIIDFDIPALQKVYGFKPRGLVRDTLILSRLIKADSVSHKEQDWRLANKGKMPKKMVGRHSLESWGYRLGNWKGDYAAVKEAEAKAQGIKDKEAITRYVWGFWNQEMQDYCEQDVDVTLDLWNHFQAILSNGWSEECVELEHETAWVIARQTAYGIGFDTARAGAFYAKLKGHVLRLEEELQKSFPPKLVEWTPKASNKKLGYVKGKPLTKSYPFNPGSGKQIAERLEGLGWQPTEYGKDGVPTLDDETLALMPWPEAKLIAEYRLVTKRIGALATGKASWLKNDQGGVIYPQVITNGAVTGRMTHKVVVNVPGPIDKKTGKPQLYGKECRELFIPRKGVMVGCDADSLEGRVMGGYMARYDGGAYTQSVIAGNKAEGTDNHSRTRDALNSVLTKLFGITVHRETAKTYFYALVYGAQDPKLGETLGVNERGKKKKVGAKSREALMKGIPGLGQLISALEAKAKKQGYIKGLDGRKLRIRALHAILNTLFQSAGAILMKRALVILDTELTGVKPSVIGTQGPSAATNLVPGKDFEFVLNYHDEWEIDTREELGEKIGALAADAIAKAGDYYNFRCPLKGNAKVGKNWADVH